ncbi:MAG: S41 family peptidase [Steroidobacteraceae bacterium]
MTSLLAIVAGFALAPGSRVANAADFSDDARVADFNTFVHDFSDNYAWPDRTEKPWLNWSDRYKLAVLAAHSPESFAAVIEAALDELHDFHAEVRAHNPHRWLPVPTFADIWATEDAAGAAVITVRRGSDAERAGIVPGDHVTAIGEQSISKAIATRLTAGVDNRDARARQWALLSLLAGRGDEERHLTVQDRSGHVRTLTLQLERHFDRPPGELSSGQLGQGIGWIRFNNSIGDINTVAAFDRALEQLHNAPGLILDLRDVPSGGDSSVALGIMGRLVSTSLPYQHHRIPNYGRADIERNWFEYVTPRGPFCYEAPVVVLVDHWTGSMGEGMAIGLDAMKRARVVGTSMAHLAGAVSDFTLPRTGIDVAFATEQLYHVDGTPRQDWLPPIIVPDTDVGPAGAIAKDPIMDYGVAELRRLIERTQTK